MKASRPGDPRNTARWRRLAEAVRCERRSACEECGAPAKDVHHVRPLYLRGAPFDRANLRLLCRPCHEKAHSQERSNRLTRGKPSRHAERNTFLQAFT